MKNYEQIAIDQVKDKFQHGPDDCDCDFCIGIREGVRTAFAMSTNYTANDDTFPDEVTFANGRKVSIAFDGDKPHLTVDTKDSTTRIEPRDDISEMEGKDY